MKKRDATAVAIEKFREFHDAEPTKVSSFDARFKIPEVVVRVGHAVNVMYRSNKWGEKADYIHEHDRGVFVHLPRAHARQFNGREAAVPARIYRVQALVKLGLCLGFSFTQGREEIDAQVSSPLPELYCTPDGRALLVVSGKRAVEAIIWGGNLGVEARGIVH
jgi:hypothetical protein